MPELISKITSMVTETTQELLVLIAIIAGCALIVWAFIGSTSSTKGKMDALKGILGVLFFVVVAISATGLVSWAVGA